MLILDLNIMFLRVYMSIQRVKGHYQFPLVALQRVPKTWVMEGKAHIDTLSFGNKRDEEEALKSRCPSR